MKLEPRKPHLIDLIWPAVSPRTIAPEPIPEFTFASEFVRPKLKSESVRATLEDITRFGEDDVLRMMYAKVAEEDARMRRLLPPPPPGRHWNVELQMLEGHGFMDDPVQVKLVYRLVDNLPFGIQP